MMLITLSLLRAVMRIKLASNTESISKDFKFFRAETFFFLYSAQHLPTMGTLGVTVIITNSDREHITMSDSKGL